MGMSRHAFLLAATALLVGACSSSDPAVQNEEAENQAASAPQDVAELSLTRLDCGTPTIKDFDKFFSDKPGLYAARAREITDSCYLIQHGDRQLVWDTGFPASWKGQTRDLGDLTARVDRTLAEQLAQLGLKPADIDIVGISHMHADHMGQASEMPQAELVIGKADFEGTNGQDDPFGPWRKGGARVRAVTGDTDVFGDGSVIAVHSPGHTPDHLALLVKLESGPVLLTGDLYHSRDAREKRGVPPFNTSREQTLQSMDKFEKLAKDTGAKVVIQHEPADIAKLPAFPRAAE
jgi:glyoxylase-like metal-dependent hydrolase (beta-lactamase superfamily II)